MKGAGGKDVVGRNRGEHLIAINRRMVKLVLSQSLIKDSDTRAEIERGKMYPECVSDDQQLKDSIKLHRSIPGEVTRVYERLNLKRMGDGVPQLEEREEGFYDPVTKDTILLKEE